MLASLEGHAQQLVDFVRLHELWAAPVVFALAFGESLAFVSLLIPAWAALVGIGVLIGSGNLNFWPVWVAGSVGAQVAVDPPFGVRQGACTAADLSSARCAPRCRWSRASSTCRIGRSRSPISPRPSFGPPCC